jgi:phytoene dehydrogenase-like protein
VPAGSNAIVVGSGPNGLAAAVALARAGVEVTVLEAAPTIGGGTRSAELTVEGLVHDVCSATHPFGAASPFFRSLPLEEHGLRWAHPEVALAHPLDGGRAALLHRSLDETAEALGADGPAWRSVLGPLVAHFDDVTGEVLRPLIHLPRHPLTLARLGLYGMPPATWVARRWKGDAAQALFAGIAAHAFRPLGRPTTSAMALVLAAAGHAVGWPVAEGGSQAIAAALASLLGELGGRIETGVAVRSLDDLPPAGAVLLDVAPSAVVAMAGDRLPDRVVRAYEAWRHGPGAYKLDLAVEGGIPWTNEDCRRAGTVHVGGTLAQIDAAEREVAAGRMPARPFVLVGQQYLADPGRSKGDVHPVWAYAHVPNGFTGDATDAVLDQIERFAPGWRERIVARQARGPIDLEADNPNYVGGDIATGLNTAWQVLVRPRLAADPYATGIPGVFLCSAATPPGAGVHGMCGAHAAASALRALRA